jgi:hypothetical protein
MLGVTDPSSRHVADPAAATPRQVDAIRIVAAARGARGDWQVWPVSGQREDVANVTWPTWDEPRFRTRRRPVFDVMRQVFQELSPEPRSVNP